MKKQTLFIAVTLIIGIAIFAFLLKFIGLGELALSFRNFSVFPFIAFILVFFLLFSIQVHRQSIILGCYGLKVGFWELMSFRFCSHTVSYITPSAMVGGEPVKAYLISRKGMKYTKALSSVLIDKFFDVAVVSIMTSVGFAALLVFFDIGEYHKSVLMITLLAWTVLLAFYIYGTITRKGFFKHIFKILQLHRIKRFRDFEHKIAETEDYMSDFFIHYKKEFRRCTVLSFICWILMFADYKIATAVLGHDIALGAVFIVMCVVGFSYLLPVPGAVGVLEALQASIHPLLGLTPAQGIAFSIVVRFRDVLWAMIGGLILYLHGISIAKEVTGSGK